ncbi:MAG: diguanylate cyclase [Acidimicrobiia bacterium]
MGDRTEILILNMILFVILPLWGFSGLGDWICHKRTHIESTSGLKESLIHALMGAQIGIPIILGIFFELSVLTYLIMFLFLVLHEFVAHWDVRYSSPKRKITIWEMHAHNYLATIPLYLFLLVSVLGWEVVKKTVLLQWSGSLNFKFRDTPIGGAHYYIVYGVFISIVCVFPYIAELLRCWRYERKIKSNGVDLT